MGDEPKFPYESFRPGQRELAEEVRYSIVEGEILTVRAPTGFGKTVSVLYGALMAGVDKVMYLVRTVNEIDPVIKESRLLGARYTFLFSARRACPLMSSEGVPLPPEDFWENCRLARARGVCKYYDRVDQVDEEDLRSILGDPGTISAVRIAWNIAEKLGSCPFFTLQLAVGESTFIVATYPYFFKRDIFDAVMSPLRYEDLVVIVDEAHTLLNAHSILEYRLKPGDIDKALEELKRYTPGYGSVEDVLVGLKRIASRRVKRVELIDKGEVQSVIGDVELIVDVAEEVRERIAEEVLALAPPSALGKVRSHLTRVANWASIAVMDESYIFIEPGENESSVLIATPLDPAVVVKEPLERVKAAVLMSGTIPTKNYAQEILGVSGKPSRFIDVELLYGRFSPPGNIYTTVVSDVTTRYVERTSYMYRRIASYITFISRNMPGLKLAVYPSYEVMEGIVEKLPVDIDVMAEGRGTRLEEVESRIRGEGGDLLINAVAGGKLVEGVEFTDYEGRNMLHIVIVVGVPFPQPDAYTRKQLEVLASRVGEGKAREYLYKHATIIKVKQALGRALRSPEDRAAYFLLDYRYLRRDIRGLMNMRYDSVVRTLYGLAQAVRSSLIHLRGGRF